MYQNICHIYKEVKICACLFFTLTHFHDAFTVCHVKDLTAAFTGSNERTGLVCRAAASQSQLVRSIRREIDEYLHEGFALCAQDGQTA